jgi:hypothetical protein
VLVSRNRDAPVAAHSAAARRGPPPARLARATAERGRHAACSSRAIATRRWRRIVRPLGAALRQRGRRGRLQSADGTLRARLARSRRAGGRAQCGRSARPSASAAGEGNCRARTAHGVLVSRDRDAPAAVHSAAARRGPPPARLGRATADRRRRAACSSRAIATRRRRLTERPLSETLRQRGWGGRLQSADGTRRARLARSRHAGGGA